MNGAPRTRRVRTEKAREYEVALVDGILQPGARPLAERIGSRRALVVTTPTVARLYARQIHRSLVHGNPQVSLFVLECDERAKSLDQVVLICDRALECGLDRRGLLVGLGGGVCTDLVTMAASWIRRGIDYIRVPTTLIGLVDSGIGIKGGLNHRGKKSYLGCFHPPGSALLDVGFLPTLPPRHVRSGLAEIVKVGLASDARLFQRVETHWPEFFSDRRSSATAAVRRTIWRSTVRLLQDLEANLYEDRSSERLSDLGHTFSPLLEAASGFELPHGEAVAIDMALSATIASRLGLLREADRDRILDLLAKIGLPLWSRALTPALCRRALEEAVLHRGGCPNLVVPVGIGAATFIRSIETIPLREIEAALSILEDMVTEAPGSTERASGPS